MRMPEGCRVRPVKKGGDFAEWGYFFANTERFFAFLTGALPEWKISGMDRLVVVMTD